MSVLNQKRRTNISLWLVVLLIAILPLLKGGNYPGAMSLFVCVMAAVFLMGFGCERNNQPEIWLIVWVVVSLAVAVHAFIFPLVLSNERFFDGGLDARVSSLLDGASLSKIRLLEVWAYFTAMWLFIWRVSIASRSEVVVLLTTLFLASSFQAIYGVVHLASGGSSVLGLWTKEYYLGDATGTFVNRNHYSGMLAIASPLVLVGLLNPRPLIFPALSRSGRFVLAAIYLTFVFLALISSHSRMGMAAGVLGIFVFLFVFLKSGGVKPQVSGLSAWKLIAFLFTFVFLLAIWFGLADILHRYAQLSDGNSRLDIWRAMLSMPLSVWLFGVGPGQFEDIFQLIKPNYFEVRFIYAHNDYLEFIFEFGLLWSVVILSVFVFWFKSLRLLNGLLVLRAGVVGSFAAVGLHSLVDFNLQVPASALCFCLALGLFVNSAMRSEASAVVGDADSSGRRKARREIKSRWPRNKREWLDFFRSE